MAEISFIKPLDQPSGQRRLLKELQLGLGDPDLTELRIIVAYAKVGPLLRLAKQLRAARAAGKKLHAIFGIDQLMTSREALDFALAHFDTLAIVHAVGTFEPTFHPKIYLFSGSSKAIGYVGSQNLTVGGTETNFEASTIIKLDLPSDATVLAELVSMWTEASKASVILSGNVIDDLVTRGLITSEVEQRKAQNLAAKAAAPRQGKRVDLPLLFPVFPVVPPSAVPPEFLRPRGKAQPAIVSVGPVGAVEALVMEIVPHPNGEVFLSKLAVNQNPSFFGFPFSGFTTPKKKANKAYRQRLPDPVVDVRIFDAGGKGVLRIPDFALNTVFYSPKSEIRVTVSPEILAAVPKFSVLVMEEPPPGATHDYDVTIYAPGSAKHKQLLAVCNQTMPSGGNARARKFGWL